MSYVKNLDGTYSQKIKSVEKIDKEVLKQQIAQLKVDLKELPQKLPYQKNASKELNEAVDLWNQMFFEDPTTDFNALLKQKKDLLSELEKI